MSSYDPTRELYQALNPLFVVFYEKETGRHVVITQSHGGSSRQARRIIRGEQSADVVTPDPRTSGDGKLAALAAWAAVVTRGGNDDEARAYLHSLYQHVPALEEGARAAAISFAIQEIADVHLTWENEALREVADFKGKLEIVYLPRLTHGPSSDG